jgi:hypothetical protein
MDEAEKGRAADVGDFAQYADDELLSAAHLDIGKAIHLARIQRMRIFRRGWNGHDMWVVYQEGYPNGIAINANTARATGVSEGTLMAFNPYLMMKTATGEFVPWVASQTDLLATDWYAIRPS